MVTFDKQFVHCAMVSEVKNKKYKNTVKQKTCDIEKGPRWKRKECMICLPH